MSLLPNVARGASLALIPLLFSSVLFAQEFRATLTGEVTDPSGAVVAQARIQAVNRDTQQAYNTTTTDKGVYFMPYVLPRDIHGKCDGRGV